MTVGPATRRRILNTVFAAVFVVFIALYLRGIDLDQLRGQEVSWFWVGVATVVALVSRLWGVLIWRTILVDLGAVGLPRWPQLTNVYAKAWLGRYVPGKVTWIAGKVYLASNHGVSKRKLAVGSVLEALLQVIAIFVLSLIFLAFDDRFGEVSGSIRLAMLAGAVLLSLSIVPPIFNRAVLVVFKLTKRDIDGTVVSTGLLLRAFGLFAVSYFLSGGSYALLTHAFHPLAPNEVLYVIAVFNLAGAIGILALVSPSGLGVREGVQLLLLPSIMPRSVALILTVGARLWSILVDLLFAAGGVIVARLSDRRYLGRTP